MRYSDKDHPFYSDKAIKERKALLKRLEKEEEEMVLENRRHYKDYAKKKKDKTEDDDSDGKGIAEVGSS